MPGYSHIDMDFIEECEAEAMHNDELANGKSTGRNPRSTPLSDIKPRKIEWIWTHKIPRGKLTLLAGMPSMGKSQISIDMMARVTTGSGWPDGDRPKDPMNVIILTTEDDPADTIVPRMMAAGADLSHVHIYPSTLADEEGNVRGWTIARDIELLRYEISAIGNVGMVTIDPLSAYLGATNSWNESEVRGIMAPLSELAADKSVAILGLAHLTKNSSSETALQRITGSVAIGALARAVFMAIEFEETRYFLNAKPSIMSKKDAHGFSYAIRTEWVQGEEGVDIETSCIEWQDPCFMTADDMLQAENKRKRPARDGAEGWLLKQLRNGPQPANDIINAGLKAGHTKHTLERLRDERVVYPRKLGFGKEGAWYWYTEEQYERLSEQKNAYAQATGNA